MQTIKKTNTKVEKTKRIVSVDYMKVLCIATMALMHWGFPYGKELMSGCRMPVLLMCSGYLFKYKDLKTDAKYMLIPLLYFIIFNFPFKFAKYLFSHHDFLGFFSKYWQAFFVSNNGHFIVPMTGMWFIMALFFTRYFMSFEWVRKYGWHLTILFVFITELNNVLNFSWILKEYHLAKIIIVFPYMYVAYQLKTWNRLGKIPPLLCLLGVGFYTLITLTNGYVNLYHNVFGYSYTATLLAGTVLFVSLYNLFNYLPFNTFIKNLSVGTFFILGTHNTPLSRGGILLLTQYVTSDRPMAVFLFAMIFFIVEYFIISFFNIHYPLMLGKKNTK